MCIGFDPVRSQQPVAISLQVLLGVTWEDEGLQPHRDWFLVLEPLERAEVRVLAIPQQPCVTFALCLCL